MVLGEYLLDSCDFLDLVGDVVETVVVQIEFLRHSNIIDNRRITIRMKEQANAPDFIV